MLNFIIVNDNKIQRKRISNIIVKRMMSNKIDFNIIEFEDYNKDLSAHINKNKFDTIFILYLELRNSDGISIAKDIRYKYNNWNCPIIIITAHDSLFYEVYKQKLQILDCVSKSDNIELVMSEDIEICLKMLNKEKVYRYTYKSVDYTINYNTIDYFQRDGRKIRIVTNNAIYYQNISINQIKDKLPNYFILSAKGIIINLRNVKKIDWQNFNVVFNDELNGYLVSKSHRKEIESFEFI